MNDRLPLPLLMNGRCEGVKASVHGVVMGLATLCSLYNGAAFLKRQQLHSAVNAGIYAILTAWEIVHVLHHLECRSTASPLGARSDAA
jgi:hypothetical protein